MLRQSKRRGPELSRRLVSGAAYCFRTFADDSVTTAFPSDCRTCGGSLVYASLVPVCTACRDRVTPQTMTLCRLCGEALDMESARFAGQYPNEGLLCGPCRLAAPQFEQAVAYAEYRDELREMIHLLKYERMAAVARPLGLWLVEAIRTLEGVAASELLVVAVPLFPAKQRQRGYNQAALIANAAVADLRRTYPRWHLTRKDAILRRTRDTESQFALTPRGRRRNLQGAFTADPVALTPGCEILLIDDIYTTGATARECARILRRAGAGKVWVATVARAQAVHVAQWGDEFPAAGMPAGQGFGWNQQV